MIHMRKLERRAPRTSDVRKTEQGWKAPAAAVLLVGGLALLPGCSNGTDTRQTTPASQPSPSMQSDPDPITIDYVKTRRTVREGDTVTIADLLFEKNGSLGIVVTKVDSDGIEFDLRNEVFMSEHSETHRLDYGKQARFGEFALAVTISATKGADSATACLEVTSPCVEPGNPGPGDAIPSCAVRMETMKTTPVRYDSDVKARLAEVKSRYDYLVIQPKVEDGMLKGIDYGTTLYGSGDTKMMGWLDYIATGIRP